MAKTELHLIFLKHNGILDNPAINQINAFQLIGMSSCLDLSGFFEKEVSPIFISASHLLVSVCTFNSSKLVQKGPKPDPPHIQHDLTWKDQT
jgi:hypothetical protein